MSDRPHYRPSGRVDPARGVAAAAALGLMSLAIAAGYAAMLAAHILHCGVPVLLFAVLAAAVARWAVRHAHCRNQALAAVAGAACGLGGYLGYYLIDLHARWGVPWAEAGRLPEFVAFRMETDQWPRGHAKLFPFPRLPGVEPFLPPARATWRNWNWANFALEALALTLAPAAAAWLRVETPYSERRGRWCDREVLKLTPASMGSLRRALRTGGVRAWAEAGPVRAAPNGPHRNLAVWYTPAAAGEEPDPEVFVSLDYNPCLALTAEEAAAFTLLLPGVREVIGPVAAGEAPGPDDASVWPVPAPYRGRATTDASRWLGKAVLYGTYAVPWLVLAAGIATAVAVSRLGVAKRVPIDFWAIPMALSAFAVVLLMKFWWHPSYFVPWIVYIRFEEWRLRRVLAVRPDPLVAADDPRAFYADMVPRRVWAKSRVSDGEVNPGLMRIDEDEGVILFEGDFDRYRIPAAAIESAGLEVRESGPVTTASPFLVVLRARLGDATWEAPFFVPTPIAGHTYARASGVLAEIETLCGRTGERLPQPPDPPSD